MGSTENNAVRPVSGSPAAALDAIDLILHQMLLLAALSASDMDVDREQFQSTLERLQDKIDRIADTLPPEVPLPPERDG